MPKKKRYNTRLYLFFAKPNKAGFDPQLIKTYNEDASYDDLPSCAFCAYVL